MRLATLPSSHLLTRHIGRVAGRYIKQHRAPLHKVLHVFNIRLMEFEEIAPVCFGPQWHPAFPVQIPRSRRQWLRQQNQLTQT